MCCLLNKNCDFGVTNNKHTNANLDQWEFSTKVGHFLIEGWKTKIWDNKAPFSDVKNHFVKQFRINSNIIFFFEVFDNWVTSLFLLQNQHFFPKNSLIWHFFGFLLPLLETLSHMLCWRWQSTPGEEQVLSSWKAEKLRSFSDALYLKREQLWKLVTLFKAWTSTVHHWTEVRQVGL